MKLFLVHAMVFVGFILGIRGCTGELANFQTPLLFMKLWDLFYNMCVVLDLKFEQKNPAGSASSLAAKGVEKFELMTPWVFLSFQGKIRVF
jgi:hypothetical protein